MNDYDLGAASVPTEELENFDEKVIESLKKVVADGIDMTRLSQIIERDRRKVRLQSTRVQKQRANLWLRTAACLARVQGR